MDALEIDQKLHNTIKFSEGQLFSIFLEPYSEVEALQCYLSTSEDLVNRLSIPCFDLCGFVLLVQDVPLLAEFS